MATEKRKDCDNCKNSDRPSYEWPCTACTTSFGGPPTKWESNIPAVDAVEVMHGWWIELPGMEPDYKCSECGRSYAWWEPSEAHYCPNCGAKMDGDGNGQ